MGLSFAAGALPPIIPYFFVSEARTAIWAAVLVSVAFLFVMGVAKTRLTKANALRSGFETMFLGVAACVVGYVLGWVAEKFI